MRIAVAGWVLLAACDIQRPIPLEQFTCENGGPCGPQPDPGPLSDCPDIVGLPTDGIVEGTTRGLADLHAGQCVIGDGPDVTYGFLSVGPLESLDVRLSGQLCATLHLYGATCDPGSQLACTDACLSSPLLRATDLPAGPIAIAIDGQDGETGPFVLEVAGTIAPGQPCDTLRPYLACRVGSCRDGTCPAVQDCPDGIDGDLDAQTDEDSCVDPPTVTCAAGGESRIGETISVSASVTAGSATTRSWALVSAPPGTDIQISSDGDDASFRPLAAGSYVARHTVVDDQNQVVACETEWIVSPGSQLHIELTWTVPDGASADRDLDLHLLHPDATVWFDTFQCSALDCCEFDPTEPWCMDPNHRPDLYDAAIVGEVETIDIPKLEVSATGYRVGVEEFEDIGEITATVRIFCDGALSSETTAMLPPTELWKVADIRFDGTTCSVTELSNGGSPVLVDADALEVPR